MAGEDASCVGFTPCKEDGIVDQSIFDDLGITGTSA